MRGCRERRNPNFSIELGERIVRSTHSGGLRNVLFGCHCFCPLLNEETRGELDGYSGGEEVSALQQTSSIGHSRASPVPTKLIQKELDFGWEQSVTGPPT
jgi:hypothetical protein